MTTRKNETTKGSVATDATSPQDRMNEVYTAHQVHTLAHLVYQQLTAGSPPMQPPWAPGAESFVPQQFAGANGQGPGSGWPSAGVAASPCAPQPLIYWYP